MEIIDSVIRTLETIQVSGRENLSRLLGCINALDSLKNEKEEKPDD